MIPVFITSCINRFDLLERMLLSVDVPVERGLIVDNAMAGEGVEAAARVGVGPEWRVWSPPLSSLGWPGTLNFGVVQTPDAPWWLFANNDVAFQPGALATIAQVMGSADRPLIVSHRWSVFAMNRAVVEKVGLFDEWSFWPLYFDDTDYARRCSLAGVEIQFPDLGITEGADGFDTSMTINSDPVLSMANNKTWIVNRQAYVAKWGGPPGAEIYDTPWDLGLPLWVTRPSPTGRNERAWR